MKKYSIDLSEYNVSFTKFVVDKDSDTRKLEETEEAFPLRKHLSDLLRVPGVHKNGVEICDAVSLAKQITECKEDSLVIDETEMKVLRNCMDKLISGEHDPENGKNALGGTYFEEMIMRVFKAKEI